MDNVEYKYNSTMKEYQKIINMLDNTRNQPTEFRTKKWVEINDDSIKFKPSMMRSSLCYYSDAYTLVKGPITVRRVAGTAQPQNVSKNLVFKNCAPFTDWISEINISQIDYTKYIDVIIPVYINILYSNNHSETSGSLLQYYRDEPDLTNAGAISEFLAADNRTSFELKQKNPGVTGDNGTKILK